MLCKDCQFGYLLTCRKCQEKILICLSEGSPDVIATKYWDKEEGCDMR